MKLIVLKFGIRMVIGTWALGREIKNEIKDRLNFMNSPYKKTLLGSLLAFILGTSCCWLSSLAIWLGGATVFTVAVGYVDYYNSVILIVAMLFFVIGLYQFWKHKKKF